MDAGRFIYSIFGLCIAEAAVKDLPSSDSQSMYVFIAKQDHPYWNQVYEDLMRTKLYSFI
jgi:hypothetical protein